MKKSRIVISDHDKRQIQSEADDRRMQEPTLYQRMLAAQESERAERGEPYDERKGG